MTAALRLAVALALAMTAAAQCGVPGSQGVPSVRFTDDLWDAHTGLVVENGAPFAPFAVFADFDAGPTSTPVGTLCIGSSPFTVASTFDATAPRLGANGRIELPMTIPPELGPLIGQPLHLQAVVLDPAAPSSVSLSAPATLVVRSPRFFLTSTTLGPAGLGGVIESWDAHAIVTGSAQAPIETITTDGFSFVHPSSRGDRLLVGVQVPLGVFLTYEPRFRLYDTSSAPAVLMGTLVLPPCLTCVTAVGTPMSFDGDAAWIAKDETTVARLDLDPSSPTFMTPVACAATSQGDIRRLVSSRRGPLLLAVGTSPAPQTPIMSVIDPATMTEIGAVPLTEAPGAIHFVRGEITVSHDQRLAMTVSTEFAASVVDIDPASPTFLTEVAAFVLPPATNVRFDPQDPDAIYHVSFVPGTSGPVEIVHRNWRTGAVINSRLVSSNGGAVRFQLTDLGNHLVYTRPGPLQVVALDRDLAVLGQAPTDLAALATAMERP